MRMEGQDSRNKEKRCCSCEGFLKGKRAIQQLDVLFRIKGHRINMAIERVFCSGGCMEMSIDIKTFIEQAREYGKRCLEYIPNGFPWIRGMRMIVSPSDLKPVTKEEEEKMWKKLEKQREKALSQPSTRTIRCFLTIPRMEEER
ncbi:hypothetical protein A3F08_02975 [Candidatus Berkelbacteria bacterium RIFCSPHIGHO2_12_FULL_36_9]|uniref:Uncharacterized protein n=1 Tax=Candidatus Berkelbacteria bacterium RIFCSPHIGHO2_12_FULL_36_9 TaxID=1797469 RepID=A0A1F5EEC5_9BACT|nr:MAG: hypothetical protein A3F08_02975 [Candidatus Berkelbacteria bacterium RIFCSPHIGHO2_12_FULL_36_9]